MPQDLSVLRDTIKRRLDLACAQCSTHTMCEKCYINKLTDTLVHYRNASSQVGSIVVMVADYMLDSNKICKK